MTFKVWDKVRLTRKALHNKCASPTRNEVFGGKVNNIDKDWYYTVVWFEDDYIEEELELVPEEPEFEYGEEIEVSDNWKTWEKVIFLIKIPWKIEYPYLCVASSDKGIFDQWKIISPCEWRYARKTRSQLTRKEIAEKFWIDKDFILVD